MWLEDDIWCHNVIFTFPFIKDEDEKGILYFVLFRYSISPYPFFDTQKPKSFSIKTCDHCGLWSMF